MKDSVKEDKPAISSDKIKPVKKPVKNSKGLKATEDFKKAYRQFYDDVKISDREDW